MEHLITISKRQYLKPVTLVILLALLSTIWSCYEDTATPPEPIEPIDLLPPLTMEGNNTFGALVNGVAVYNVSSTRVFAQYPSASYLQFGGSMENDRVDRGMGFVINSRLSIGEVYDLTSSIGSNSSYSDGIIFEESDEFDPCWNRQHQDLISGEVEIVYINIVDRVVAGRFEMTFVEDGCDTIKITDGRFDAIIQFM